MWISSVSACIACRATRQFTRGRSEKWSNCEKSWGIRRGNIVWNIKCKTKVLLELQKLEQQYGSCASPLTSCVLCRILRERVIWWLRKKVGYSTRCTPHEIFMIPLHASRRSRRQWAANAEKSADFHGETSWCRCQSCSSSHTTVIVRLSYRGAENPKITRSGFLCTDAVKRAPQRHILKLFLKRFTKNHWFYKSPEQSKVQRTFSKKNIRKFCSTAKVLSNLLCWQVLYWRKKL